MIEVKDIAEHDFYELVNSAPHKELEGCRIIVDDFKLMPFDFFQDYAIEKVGFYENGKPIYFAAITLDPDSDMFDMWTIAAQGIQEHISLYKNAKRLLLIWAKKHGDIKATMMKDGNAKNVHWTRKMGFDVVDEQDDLVTLQLKGA